MNIDDFLYKAKHVSGIDLYLYISEKKIQNIKSESDETISTYEKRGSLLIYHLVKLSDLSVFEKQ